MYRYFITLYGFICYCLFILVFIYAEGFLLEIVVPKSINSGATPEFSKALLNNLLLLMIFGFFHSLMSRDWFKKIWTQIIPVPAERSSYVLQASILLAVIMWQWQPLTGVLWSLQGVASWPFYTCFFVGNVIVIWSTFLMNHFELFGLSQVWHNQTGKPIPETVFKTPSLYKFVRHPMHFGVLMIFWSTPVMTIGHFVFALSMTLYVLIGLCFEERSLQREFGAQYTLYRKQVPMLIPRLFLDQNGICLRH